ncbi:Uncharacterised protein [Salmonella enterica subsp. enterica]|nr:Uncharacterised protein [Salmonella enterica subsp. enterica]
MNRGGRKGKREGVQQGIQQGIHQGKQEEALRIAHTMLEQGIEREMVLMITGLSDEEIRQAPLNFSLFRPVIVIINGVKRPARRRRESREIRITDER